MPACGESSGHRQQSFALANVASASGSGISDGERGTVPICAKHPSGRSGKLGLSPLSHAVELRPPAPAPRFRQSGVAERTEKRKRPRLAVFLAHEEQRVQGESNISAAANR